MQKGSAPSATGQKDLQTQRSTGGKALHSMGTAIRPVERHGLEAISFFLYDPKEGTILGRTPRSWLLITIFYIIYYSLLAGFWALCFFLFYKTTITEQEPRWNGKDSNGIDGIGKSPALIGQSPALGYRPAQTDALIESSMIMYNHQQKDEKDKIPGWGGWQERTAEFLEQYKDCKNTDLFCGTQLEKCAQGNFGWDEGKPCILLKLNKIFGLEHAYYNQTKHEKQPGYVPKDFPKELKDTVVPFLENKDTPEEDKNQVWVNCKGENAADQEKMGPIKYFPKTRGFHEKYNYYGKKEKREGYRPPLVAVKFENPVKGQLIHVECRAWAKNIKYHHMDRIGKAHFELIVYDSKHNMNVKGSKTTP